MDDLDLILWLFLVVGSAGALAAFLFYGGAFLIQRIRLLWIEIESNRIDMLAKRANLKIALDQNDLQTQVISLDANGLPPISRKMIESGLTTEAAFQIALAYIESQRTHAPTPTHLTYAPHVKNDKLAVVDDAPSLLEQHAMIAKNFFQLYQDDKLPKDKFLIGFDLEDEQPVIAGWSSLYSALIGGQSGSGKSTLIRNVLAQSALQGGRFAILDPHFASGEESLGASLMPLRRQMLFDVASNDNEMVQAIKYITDVGRRRLAGTETDRTPLVVIVDETTALLSRGKVAPQLLALLELIAQETRKVGVYAMCIGQQFSAETMKTTARNSFVSMLSCRARRDVARMQSGNIQFAKLAEQLTVGQAVWMAPTGEVRRLAVPNTTQRHLEAIGQIISGESTDITQRYAFTPVEPLTKPLTRPLIGADFDDDLDTNVSGEVSRMVSGNTQPLTIRDQRALQMFCEGCSPTDIVKTLWEVAGGPPYQKAAKEFNDLLRAQIGGAR